MPPRQKLEEIERKKKRVEKAASWSTPAGVSAESGIARRVEHIVRCIENGSALSTGHYRKGKGDGKDTLLNTEGIMHLHLGRQNTPELLFLVQYPDHVVLLELSDHARFDDRPIGKGLRAKHNAALAAKEAEIDAVPPKPKVVLKPRKATLPEIPQEGGTAGTDPSSAGP